MPKYSYKDVIIDPTSDEAKNCIGKMVYYADNPNSCLAYANYRSNDVSCEILQEINTSRSYPFLMKYSSGACIIPKKEEQNPEYVPFESADEFLKAFCDSIQNDVCTPVDARIRFLGGIWLKQEYEDSFDYYNVTEICDKLGLVIGSDTAARSWNNLLKNYKFLDGTPCGKIKE